MILADIHTPYVHAKVNLRAGTYHNGAIALFASDPDTWQRLFVATVNLPKAKLSAQDCVWLKGWAENEGIPDALVKAGICKLTGRRAAAGYAVALEAKLLVPIEQMD